jgi:hypothetical protein
MRKQSDLINTALAAAALAAAMLTSPWGSRVLNAIEGDRDAATARSISPRHDGGCANELGSSQSAKCAGGDETYAARRPQSSQRRTGLSGNF